jgi:RNA polymerase sigma-70 factor, ECF subfamily
MSTVLHDDNALIENARAGDARAFSALVKKYEQLVYGYSFKVCRDRDKAAETLQDTFINVYKSLDQFNNKSKFSTWLYSIVTNNCLMKRRKRKIDQEMVYLDEPPADDEQGIHLQLLSWDETPSEKLQTKELRDQLDNAIQKLPVEYRVVFILRDIEDQSAEETAQILKLSIPAVKSRLRRARVFLRNELQGLLQE